MRSEMTARRILLACIAFFGVVLILNAQTGKEADRSGLPLEEFLKKDGTLDLSKGYSGSLDPRGWRMATGKNGEPLFFKDKAALENSASYPSGPMAGDENWDSQFSFPGQGTTREVEAMAICGSDLYVGGWFTQAGDVAANHIAKWDGSAWSSLGSGVNDWVFDIAVSGSDIYVGGFFTQAGGVAANRIAKWNGSVWSSLGSGVNGWVFDIAVSGSNIYVGGNFTQAGGIAVNYIARWNGSAWSSLAGGTNGSVSTIAASASAIYAGGGFTQAGGVAANHIARWNGSSWSSLGSGTNDSVCIITLSGSDIYAGGWFTQAGGVAANHIARWNGSAWSSIGGGVNDWVYALAINGSDLYVGGWFNQAGAVAVKGIARWDGSAWSSMGGGMDDWVWDIAIIGSDVYACGEFLQAGGINVNRIGKWNGVSWSSLGSGSAGGGMNYIVHAVADREGVLYAGGEFKQAGGAAAKYIARWDGSAWSSLGSGFNLIAFEIAVSGSEVYAGGQFTQAGGVAANRIARWDGSAWSSLGTGMSSHVIDIAVSGSDVYAGGQFTQAGGKTVNHIARWDGSAWSSLGSGVNGDVQAITVNGGDVYVGGLFTLADGISANNIAKWDGSAWSALGSGVNGYVFDIAVNGSDVYAGGQFTQAGVVATNHMARWDGSAWSSVGGGVNNDVNAIAVYGSHVYAGGTFTQADGIAANHIARWNGVAWSSLGSGVDGSVTDLVMNGNDVYVGGEFCFAGGKSSSYIACWHSMTETVATPAFTPPAGVFYTAQDVTISCSTPGVTIHYTTDGDDPTENDAVYSGPVRIASTATLKAKAFKLDWAPSAVAGGLYTIRLITDLRASLVDGHILLEWSPIPGATGYCVYLGTQADFAPDTAGGSNRIADNAADEDAGTTGVQWTDPAAAAGDTTTHHFWKVTGLMLNGETGPSNPAGEFAYPLYSTPVTDINEVVLGMDTRLTRNPIRTAEELAAAIPHCTVVYAWNASYQGAVGHPKGYPFNNFNVFPGLPYSVNVPVDGIWTVTGGVPDTSFTLVTTAGTDINHIGVPFSKETLTTAEQLVGDIPNGTVVYQWAPRQQGSIGHPKGMPFNDFTVKANYPYYVNVTAGSPWPSSGSPSPMAGSAIHGGQKLSKASSGKGLPGSVQHLAFGKYRYDSEIPVPSVTGDIHIRAWIAGKPDEILTEATVGTGIDSAYWWVNTGGFPAPWKAGEELIVVLEDSANGLSGRGMLKLTNEGADVLDMISIDEPLRKMGIQDGFEAVPRKYALEGCYPNPFNPGTTIVYRLPERSDVSIEVYDTNGRRIRKLISGVQEPGEHKVAWDATDDAGRKVMSGVYLCRMEAGVFTGVKKLLMIK
jgi:trimeric autotransporter adhesin